jgi:hypothetical protein
MAKAAVSRHLSPYITGNPGTMFLCNIRFSNNIERVSADGMALESGRKATAAARGEDVGDIRMTV